MALTIAGSDSGGGAGIQADLKAFSALGTYGASVITAVTAQNTRGVTAVHGIPLDVIRAQIDAVLSDLNVRAIKIGMLATPDIIETVALAIQDFSGPVVLDPVMVAKSGDRLLATEAIDALKTHLISQATLVTPNLPEAAELLGEKETDVEGEVIQQGKSICALGAQSVLMKGGHAKGEICTDWLINAHDDPVAFTAKRIATNNTHGTGCTLSSSIAANLAKGQRLEQAVNIAHQYLHQAIAQADQLDVGAGHGPVHHFHAVW
ncbi:MAG: bifunctional hydroxymethylpyrimidine kinase/phosphomethylpyrimidine kinase [Granulosicoccus sp.]|nr:bifunctional hydroxymethylpyrimidine kinase/phosphomethylpyrimidine kinase [Granulosicoccus sp.]